MFGDLDMGKMTEMLKEMESKAKQIQEQAASLEFTAKGGGGLISVSANGAGEITDITIDDSLLSDKSSLQIMLISTVNDVLKMVEDNKKSQAMGMFGGLNPFGGS
jgi:DNA-binding YbaB/EbfC family protein